MRAAQRKSCPAAGTAEAAEQENDTEGDYDQRDRKTRLTKSDAARLLSIWLDRVYDNDAVQPSGFKLAYRIAKRCRATFAKQGRLHSFEGKESLASSVGISEKHAWNLISTLVDQHLLHVVRRGKGLTNLLVPALSDRNCISDHFVGSDRQSVSGHDDRVTGNPVPSDRQSSSRLTGNGFPVHIEEGVELRSEVEGGEGFQPSPSHLSSSNTLSSENGSDALEGASGQGDQLVIGGAINIRGHGICIVRDLGLIGRSRFVKASALDTKKLIFVPVSDRGHLMINDWMFQAEFETTYRKDDVRWGDAIDNPAPKSRGKRNAAA